MDLRAHGRTSSSSSPGIVLDYSAMAKDVFETLEYLRINKVHIIGHSMGGKVASMLALTYPQIVQSLAVIDISPVPYEATDFHMVSNLILKLKEMAIEQQLLKDRNNANTYLSSREIDANMIPFLLSNLVLGETGYMEWKFDLNVIVDSLQNVINFEPQPSSPPYQGPLLLIKAGSSNFILSKHLSAIQALFSKYSLVSIRDCGHWVHAEKPEDLANILCKFVTTF
jgi:esterase